MSANVTDPLLALIRERGLVDDLQIEEVLQENNRSGKPIGQILVDLQIMDLESQLALMAEHLGTEVVHGLVDLEIPPEVLACVSPATARMYQCLPLELTGNSLKLTLVDPMNPSIVDQIQFVVRKEIQIVVADPNVILNAIAKFYVETAETFGDIMDELGGEEDIVKEVEDAAKGEQTEAALANMANETPIVRFVNLVLFQAVQDRASDIHFEPFEDEFKIRYRVDGALYEMAPPPKYLGLPVTSRLKILANLNISE